MAASYSTTIADEPGINNPTTNYVGVKNMAVEDNSTTLGQVSYLPVARNITVSDSGLVPATVTPTPQSLIVDSLSESRSYNNPPAVDTVTTSDTTRVIVGEGNTVVQTSDNVVIYINNNEKDTSL